MLNLPHKLLYLNLIRITFFLLILGFINYLLNFETSFLFLSFGVIAGVFAASFAVQKNFRFFALIIISSFVVFAWKILFVVLDNFFAPEAEPFLIYNIFEHLNLILTIFLIAFLSSFLFLRYKLAGIIEALLVILFFNAALSAHENYRFDLLKIINDLAWKTGFSPLIIVIAIAFLIFTLLIIYLLLSGALPLNREENSLEVLPVYSNTKSRLVNLLTVFIILIAVYFFARELYFLHYKQAETILQNGVGSAESEGMSPLDFKSALGSSNQPSALLRLKSDYQENPYSPMLYIRESALSLLDGNKMLLAFDDYDPDISRTHPQETFIRKNIINLPDRKELEHSVYLLGKHKMAFAIDFPLRINPLKLSEKNKKKFKAAYQAVSLVPTYKLADLFSRETGNPNWTKKQWMHYTKMHENKEYQKLAEKITRGISGKVNQASAIAAYLSKNAIYTLAPHHEVEENEDPTEKFLFGDLRGYCVHFAHAEVYMMRALGIPSRIATGYLTDLSQSKDGNILLRMSDRHAWAEIYIKNAGWVVFDVQPEQVELHGETPVDQNMLDELIDLLGTDDEIISDELLKDEIEEDNSNILKQVSFNKLFYPILVLLSVIYLRKYYLLFGWKFTSSDEKKLKKLYLAIISIFYDLGYERNTGETKEQYLSRVSKRHLFNSKDLSNSLNALIYANRAEAVGAQNFKELLNSLNAKEKIILFLNPKSVISGVGLWRF